MPPSRREIQGPKPPPLTVNKDSWKVKKVAPAATSSGRPPAADRRNPVIVYVRTPRIIHATPQEFMSLVQSLTGKDSRPNNRCSSAASDRSGVSTRVEFNGTNSGNEEEGRCSASSNSGGEADVDPLLLTLGQLPFTPSEPSAISPSFLFCSPTTNRLLQEFSKLL